MFLITKLPLTIRRQRESAHPRYTTLFPTRRPSLEIHTMNYLKSICNPMSQKSAIVSTDGFRKKNFSIDLSKLVPQLQVLPIRI